MKDPDTKDHVFYVALGRGLVIGEHSERGDGHLEREVVTLKEITPY